MTRSLDEWTSLGDGLLPAHLGIEIQHVDATEVRARMPVKRELMAPNGYLHAGSLVTLADTCAGYGCRAGLPPAASGFTTVELKSNHLGTLREGVVACRAVAVHRGRTTQVWDATCTDEGTGRTLVLFRCTQMLLYPPP